MDLSAYNSLIVDASAKWSVPSAWIQAVIAQESSGNPSAYNGNDPSGAYGLMQILYSTAVSLGYSGDPSGLFDPETNIDLGTNLLAQLAQSYGSDFAAVYSAYNSGSPTAYQTSGQVAANVASASSWLSQFAGDIGAAVTQNPDVDAGLVLAALIAGYLIFAHGKI